MSVKVSTTQEMFVAPPSHYFIFKFHLCPSLSSLQMFEKFSISDVDSSGRGGEYTVQAGFGWTNGVVLWVASTFGKQLVAPACPDPLSIASSTGSTS
jgi:hypothetical protein